MKEIKEILKENNGNPHTVNSNKDNIKTGNSNTVKQFNDLTLDEKLNNVLKELQEKPKYLAEYLAQQLDDKKSIRYYEVLALNVPANALFDALNFTLSADREGKIRVNKAVYFQAILRRWKYKTSFKAKK